MGLEKFQQKTFPYSFLSNQMEENGLPPNLFIFPSSHYVLPNIIFKVLEFGRVLWSRNMASSVFLFSFFNLGSVQWYIPETLAQPY